MHCLCNLSLFYEMYSNPWFGVVKFTACVSIDSRTKLALKFLRTPCNKVNERQTSSLIKTRYRDIVYVPA